MTSRHLYAIHEFDNAWASIVRDAGVSAWTVTTHALGHDAQDRSGYDFRPIVEAGITPMARLNNGYEPEGTIPDPGANSNLVAAYAERCRNFVAASSGCTHWIIGNEPNHIVERPHGVVITARMYAVQFVACRNLIKQLGGNHQVIVGAVGPWNVQSGDWLVYWAEVLTYIAANGGAGGLAIHAYTRTDIAADIVSDVKMNADGYTDRYDTFRTYRDTMNAIPAAMRSLPVYMTEFDELPGWTDRNTGVVQAAYAEIDRWNETPGTQKILMLALYRWPKFDRWWIVGKNGVLDDFREALKRGYLAPSRVLGAGPGLPTSVATPSGSLPSPLLAAGSVSPTRAKVDPRLTGRGVKIVAAQVDPGKPYWYVESMKWLDVEEAIRTGPDHHILCDLLDEQGARVFGENKKLLVTWPDGGNTTIPSEEKKNELFSANYAMSGSLNEFNVRVDDGLPSETVTGIGMGKDGNKNIHTSTVIIWRRGVATQFTVPVVIKPVTSVKQPVPILIHPIPDPAKRQVSQPFGGNRDFYSRFKVDGVPLLGHNGVDYEVAAQTPIRAVADGYVGESNFEADGWGHYVKVMHVWGETLYAHLSTRLAALGDTIKAGQIVGLSGSTGASSGPHLHVGMRTFPYDRQDGWGGYIDPLPYLLNTLAVPVPQVPITVGIPQSFGIIEPVVAAAIFAVESNGSAFGPDGSMVIRFEPHIFRDRVPAASFDRLFKVGEPVWDGKQHRFLDPLDNEWKAFHGSIKTHQQFEWRAFQQAQSIDIDAAHESIAMGLAQVMGFNYRRIGFSTAMSMFQILKQNEAAQVMAFVNYVLSDSNLYAAMRRKEFETVARLYNGGANVAYYAGRMRDELARLIA